MWNSHENLLKCEKDAGFNYEGHKIYFKVYEEVNMQNPALAN